MTRYISRDLEYFFRWAEIKHVLGRTAVENRNVTSVSDFIDQIEKIDCSVLSLYIIKKNYSEDPVMQEHIDSLFERDKELQK